MRKNGIVKVALFDLDGVVVDTESQYSEFWNSIGKEFVPEIENFSDRTKGVVLTTVFSTYFEGREDVQAEIVRRINVFERDMDYVDVPGVVPFIESLRLKGIKTAVVTSSSRKKMDSFFKSRADLLPLFDHVFTGEDFERSKPDPYCYLLGARFFGAEIDECVVFEDSYNGLRAAKDSGIYTVGLSTTLSKEEVSLLSDEVIPDFLSFRIDY